jgi:hypothetical protein
MPYQIAHQAERSITIEAASSGANRRATHAKAQRHEPAALIHPHPGSLALATMTTLGEARGLIFGPGGIYPTPGNPLRNATH